MGCVRLRTRSAAALRWGHRSALPAAQSPDGRMDGVHDRPAHRRPPAHTPAPGLFYQPRQFSTNPHARLSRPNLTVPCHQIDGLLARLVTRGNGGKGDAEAAEEDEDAVALLTHLLQTEFDS